MLAFLGHPDSYPDPLVRSRDQRMRIPTKMSRIRNTASFVTERYACNVGFWGFFE
jgi:hypothetical protein